MNTVPDIQASPNWQIVTGESINGTPDGGIPTLTLTQRPMLIIDIAGVAGKYADGVARSPDYPIPANTGHALLTVVFGVSDTSLEFTEALEMGAKFTLPNGLTLNGQLQFSYASATDMTLDLTSITGSGWSKTQVTIPKFAPHISHRVSIAYVFTDENIGVASVAVDGTLYTIPIQMQGVPGKALGWAANHFQTNFQANTNPKGGSWQWTLSNVCMDFS